MKSADNLLDKHRSFMAGSGGGWVVIFLVFKDRF